MGYEDVKLNLGNPHPCDLQIGQILYYEKNFILLEVEIVSIDCSLEDTIKLQCKEVVKGSERCTMFKFCGNKNEVFGKNKFVLYNNDLSCGDNSTWHREGTTFTALNKFWRQNLFQGLSPTLPFCKTNWFNLKACCNVS